LGFLKEKQGLETKVRVLEELKETVIRHEAEIEAGRWEREAW
jgi:mitotic spindle assembly checkpoint protein MAD1